MPPVRPNARALGPFDLDGNHWASRAFYKTGSGYYRSQPELLTFAEAAVSKEEGQKSVMFLIEGDQIVGRFPDDSDEPYRVAGDGAVIIDKDSAMTVNWKRDLALAAMELSDTTLSCERAAVLAIPGAAETVESMRRLSDEIDARLRQIQPSIREHGPRTVQDNEVGVAVWS